MTSFGGPARGSKGRRRLVDMAPEGKVGSRVGVTKPTLEARKKKRRGE